MTKVSVIIPVYNVEKYIVQCLDSIKAQTFQDYEVLIVDDGSPDNSPQICDTYAENDTRFRVIHKKNGGVSDARNRGLAEASGEWVYLVDADDWLEPDALEKLYKVATEQSVDCVLTDCVERYTTGQNRRLKMFSEPFRTDKRSDIEQIQKAILCHKYSQHYSLGADNEYPAPWSKFFKLSLVRAWNLEFDPYVMGYYDDGLFTMYLLDKTQSVYYCGYHTYNYRIVAESLMHGFREKTWEGNIRNCEKMDLFINQTAKNEEFIQAEYCRRVSFFAALLSSYFFNLDNPASKKDIRKKIKTSLREYPYHIAFKKARISNFENKHKYILICGKIGFVFGFEFYAWAKRRFK